jgi:oligopeptide transport system permease protein
MSKKFKEMSELVEKLKNKEKVEKKAEVIAEPEVKAEEVVEEVKEPKIEKAEKIEKPALSFMQDAWRRLKKNKLAVISLWFIGLLLVFAIGSTFVVSTKSANKFNSEQVEVYRNLPPKISDNLPFWNGSIVYSGNTEANDAYADQSVPEETKFVLGTDNLGRSIAKRVTVGIRISLLIAVIATLIDLIIGVTYGLISGFSGGKVDTIMQRIIEVISSIPNLVIVTMLGLLLGNGVTSIIISIAIVGWTSMARQVRNLTLSYKERDFVLASRALGESNLKIAFKHVLPNISGIIIVQIMMTVPSAIMYESVLSAINLGVKPPTASLGSLITDAQENLQYYPYQVMIPAAALVLISLAFILLGDGLRDAFDPKSSAD